MIGRLRAWWRERRRRGAPPEVGANIVAATHRRRPRPLSVDGPDVGGAARVRVRDQERREAKANRLAERDPVAGRIEQDLARLGL